MTRLWPDLVGSRNLLWSWSFPTTALQLFDSKPMCSSVPRRVEPREEVNRFSSYPVSLKNWHGDCCRGKFERAAPNRFAVWGAVVFNIYIKKIFLISLKFVFLPNVTYIFIKKTYPEMDIKRNESGHIVEMTVFTVEVFNYVVRSLWVTCFFWLKEFNIYKRYTLIQEEALNGWWNQRHTSNGNPKLLHWKGLPTLNFFSQIKFNRLICY